MTAGAQVTLGEPPTFPTSQTGWRKVRFGDVVRNVNNNVRDFASAGIERVVGLEHLDSDSLHIRRWASSADGTTFTRRFKPGQVLFGKRRAYQRKVAVAEFEGVCSGDILVFEPANDDLLPELLPFIVQSDGFFEHALGTSAGSLSPRTRWQDLAAYQFDLPPLAEQRRIAQLLWAADEAIDCSYAVSEAVQDANAVWLTEIFNESCVQARGWKKVKLSECGIVQTGLAKGRSYNADDRLVELPYLSVANVQDGYLDLTEVKRIKITLAEAQRYALRSNDVLLTEGGDFDKLGRGTVWKGEIEDCLHQNHVFCVRTNTDILLPEFLSLQTSSIYGKKYFLSCSKQTTNLASVNATQVKAFPVLLPSIDVQRLLLNKAACFQEA
jgi:restriction endonuclease S subunit